MIIKRLLAIYVAMLLAFACAACGREKPVVSEQSGQQAEQSSSFKDSEPVAKWSDARINGNSLSEYIIVRDGEAAGALDIADSLHDLVYGYTGGKIDLETAAPDEADESKKQIRIGAGDRSGRPSLYNASDYAVYADGDDLILNATKEGLENPAAKDALLKLFDGFPEENVLSIDVSPKFRVASDREYLLRQIDAVKRADVCPGVVGYDYRFRTDDHQDVLVYVTEISPSSGCRLAVGMPDDGVVTGHNLSQTVLDMAVSAKEHGKNVVCAINSGFFDLAGDKSSNGVIIKDGVCITEGTSASPKHEWWGFTDQNKLIFGMFEELYLPQEETMRTDIKEAASGRRFLLREGTVVSSDFESDRGLVENRHPRSCIMLRENGDIVLFVADGRYKGSAGLSFDELTEVAIRLGGHTALNLDGGGSSQLVTSEGGELHVINIPEGRDPKVASLRKVATGILVIAP